VIGGSTAAFLLRTLVLTIPLVAVVLVAARLRRHRNMTEPRALPEAPVT
jgi:hypothetical protein